MKQPKVIQYHHLVSVARQVVLSIKLDHPETYQENDGGKEISLMPCKSVLYLYGGYAPSNLKELLTYHQMHKIRKEWADKHLFKYFKIFFPSLTKKQMWKVIVERRLVFRPEYRKQQQRMDIKSRIPETKVDFVLPRSGKLIRDTMPTVDSKNYNRLFPMPCIKYVQFIIDRCYNKPSAEKYIMSALTDNGKKYFYKDEVEIQAWATASNDNLYPYGIDFKLFMIPGMMRIIQKPNKTRAIDRDYYFPDNHDNVDDDTIMKGGDMDEE